MKKTIAVLSLIAFAVLFAQESTGPRLIGTINKVTITPPASAATLTIVNGKTLTVNKTITLDGTDGVIITGPPSNATVATLGLTNTLTGRQDASGAASTSPAKAGTSIPGTCTVGDQFFKTDATAGQNLYYCTATNTFTQQLNSGGGGGAGRPYLNYQGTNSDVTGDNTIYSYTLPGNTMGASGCVTIAWNLNSTNVSGSPVFNLSFGGTVAAFKPQPSIGHNLIGKFLLCNTGATNSQVVLLDGPMLDWLNSGQTGTVTGFGAGISITYSKDTTASQVIAITVTGTSGGNAVGPGYFIVY